MNNNIKHNLLFHASLGKTIGLCHGCFDLLHAGHIMHFSYAKSIVDILVVSITAAEYVAKAKGQMRPFFSDDDRLLIADSIKFVDYAFIHDEPTASSLLKTLPLDYYFKGPDYNNNLNHDGLQQEIQALQSRTKLLFTPTRKDSSTSYINKILAYSPFP